MALITAPHPGDDITVITNSIPITDENTAPNVSFAFGRISRRTDFNAFHEQNMFDQTTYTTLHNHFQGIQRLRDGRYFVISGGSSQDKSANLLICNAQNFGLKSGTNQHFYDTPRLESAIGSNLMTSIHPPNMDRAIGIYKLNKDRPKFWHAGGMDTLGDILGVPLENSKDKKSVVCFYDCTNPEKPKKMDSEITIIGNAGCVALSRLQTGQYICALWTDSDDNPDRFEFYFSDDFKNWSQPYHFLYHHLTPDDQQNPKFQSINFVKQSDGRLYLIGTENSNKLAPVICGKDRAYLYEVMIGTQSNGKLKVDLCKISQREFEGGGSYANFGGAAGCYVNSRGQLALYSAHHWRSGGNIKIGEYWPTLEVFSPAISYKRDLIIELYEHRYFNGRCLRIFGEKFAKISDFDNVRVEGKVFNDRISSIRYLIPENYKLVIYKNKNHQGHPNPFQGSDRVVEHPDLGMANDDFSSCVVLNV